MSLYDKQMCPNCEHPRYRHTGTHLKGSKDACVYKDPQTGKRGCTCVTFIDSSVCTKCGGVVCWIDSPGGGWWVHFAHPTDNHDAVSVTFGDDPPDWSTDSAV